MSDFDDILKSYVENILKLQSEKSQEVLSHKELQEVASRLGLTNTDLIYIEKRFAAYYTRGINYIKYGNWDKAIQELEQACNIKPISAEALYRLADAYRRRYIKKGKKQDRFLAEKFAQRCLQIEYKHEKAIALVSQIHRLKPKRRKKQWLKYLLVLILLSTVVFLAYVLIRDFILEQPEELTEEIPIPKKVEKPKQEKNKIQELPIDLDDEAKIFGLSLDIENSYAKREGKGFHYTFKGSIINNKYEVSELSLVAVILNQNNKVIYEENLSVFTDREAELQPGDAVPFSFSLHKKFDTKKIKAIRLDVYNIEKEVLEEAYQPKDTLTKYYMPEISTDLMLEVRERRQTIIPNANSFEHEIVLEYQNLGKVPIRELEVEIEWYNKSFNLVYNSIVTLIKSNDPILKPTHRRRWKKEYFINLKNSQYRYYKVKVRKIR